jgi:hypothetical protein
VTECYHAVFKFVRHMNCMPPFLYPLSNILHATFMHHVLHKWCGQLPKYAVSHNCHGHAQGDTQCISRIKARQQKHATV